MPINLPQFQGGQVPIPRPIQPFQQPQHYDPAGVIMQAAALRQQRDLAQQQMQQKSLDSVIEAIQSAASLSERKREADMSNTRAQMMQDIAIEKLGPETALMQAHANYFNSMSMGGDEAVNGAVNMLHSGLASPQDIYSLASRWPQNQKVKLMSALSQSGIDLKSMGLDLTYQKAVIRTQQGPAFQQRIRGGESILPNFQSVIDQANAIGLGKFAPANKIKLAFLRAWNDEDVAKYDTTRKAVAEEMARYFGGGVSSDMKIKMGQDILGNDGANSASIQAALMGTGGAYDVIKNQIKAFQGNKSNYMQPRLPGVMTRTLSDGSSVNVRQQPDGSWQEVE